MMKVLENNYVPSTQGYTGICPKCASKIFFQDSDYRVSLNEVVAPGKEQQKFLVCPCCGKTVALNEWRSVTPTDGKLYD